MSMFLVKEDYVNATKGYRFGSDNSQEVYAENTGQIYRQCRAEHGRCTGKMYIDTKSGTKQVGWVFVKRKQYSDARNGKPESYYLQETWVMVHKIADAFDD